MNWQDILNFILSLFTSSDTPSNEPSKSNPEGYTIIVDRGSEESSGIYSSGSLSWDSFKFEVLENDAYEIPAGTYKLQWHTSAHLNGEVVPELIGVPGRSSILMHEGNTENCSEGCLLVGSCRDGNAIDNSKTTLGILKDKINAVGIENVSITIQ
jgi:hypothetical protein